MALKLIRRFAYTRETKGTYRYDEVEADSTQPIAVGGLYLRKDALRAAGYGNLAPLHLSVTILEED